MVSINIGRKEFLFIVGFFVLMAVAGVGIAYGGNKPTEMGHSAGEMDVRIGFSSGGAYSNTFPNLLSLQELFDKSYISYGVLRDSTTPFTHSGLGLIYDGRYGTIKENYWEAKRNCLSKGGFLPSYSDFYISVGNSAQFFALKSETFWTSTEVPIIVGGKVARYDIAVATFNDKGELVTSSGVEFKLQNEKLNYVCFGRSID